jgi:sugar-specific transcriptional regulator TrmB
MPDKLLIQLGLSKNEAEVYLSLLGIGPASIRRIASETEINRGTVYESLKKLIKRGLVSRSESKNRKQFVAEDPVVLGHLFKDERRKLVALRKELNKSLPVLQGMKAKSRHRPIIRIYEGAAGTRFVLEDVLRTMTEEKEKEYLVYSSADIRKYLYKNFASFSDRRIGAGIKTKVIALGGGGELRGLDERKWLSKNSSAPTYVIIYKNKVAMISLGEKSAPISVIIEDEALAQTHKLIFEELWKFLK